MEWIYLIIAGLCEVGFVIFMKLSEGFTRHRYTILTLVLSAFSFYFLSKALLVIPIGTGYGIWTGIGAAGSVILGILFFGESRNWKRVMFILMIVAGVVGLKSIA
ncbi:DMT family transporter [Niallia oryzisoli]|uniref:DMT family transporter n=1 Tax=Niallia oryzisoli TaxID=1737571 RepID=UPI00373645EC